MLIIQGWGACTQTLHYYVQHLFICRLGTKNNCDVKRFPVLSVTMQLQPRVYICILKLELHKEFILLLADDAVSAE